MKTKLTPKERKFWIKYCETQSLTESAKAVGSNGKDTKSLCAVGRKMLDRIAPTLPETLTAMGLDDALVARKTLEGLDATRTQLASFEGRFTDERTFQDYPTRAKYLELLGRFKGAFIDKHELTGKDGGDLILQIAPRMPGRSKGIEIE